MSRRRPAPQEVAKAGGHQAMMALRGAVRSGAVGAFAAGGAVGNGGAVVRTQYGATENAVLSAIAAERKIAAAASAGAPGGGVAGRGNVDAELLRRFDAWNASVGGALRIVSGYRSSAKQAALYALYRAGLGNLAARPGTSKHERSPAEAIDYGPASWARTVTAYRFGLAAPVRSEPWHLEVARGAFDDGGLGRTYINPPTRNLGVPA